MGLSRDQVKKVAKLGNLPISEKEEEKYSGQLSKVLDYIDQLNEVKISAVEPTFNVTSLSNVMAEDKPVFSLSSEQALANTPKQKNGFFATKGIFEE